ncbi:fibulin-2 isoform X1 [Erpetoichthys calabaricus]|uniref:fibulin-2 isoform X1 n=1 Tax=Erpetoichthys calabaricus TaxID=27687 RepID=UPI00109FE3D3|nr:fibulin-2 isoform X1 [Erpetoichthys calabaricus]
MAAAWLLRSVLLKGLLLWQAVICSAQNDCTGAECLVLENCIEEVLEVGSCCASCMKKGCTCEGYQYYDCVNAGFRNGKVPEGKSYLVDFGSTECSCPKGGGKITCHFIPCPEIPPNCIELDEPSDSCSHCKRIGCTHGDQTYEAGYTFQMDACQVCHCPKEGGDLMCYPKPDCQSQATEEGNHRKHYDEPYSYDQEASEDQQSKEHSRSLSIFKTDQAHTIDNDYDYPEFSSTQRAKWDTVSPTISSLIPALDREHPSPNDTLNVEHRLRDTHLEEVTDTPILQTTQVTPLMGPSDNVTETMINLKLVSEPRWLTSTDSRGLTTFPPVRFNPTSQPEEVVKATEHEQQRRQSQSFLHYDAKEEERPSGTLTTSVVSTKDLIESCCSAGQQWAAAGGQCDNMQMPDKNSSVCRIAQKQCCMGYIKENNCLAGVTAAREGEECDVDESDICGADIYKECCTCCSLGLKLRTEGLGCESHSFLGYPCNHMILACCEGEEGHIQSSLNQISKLETTSLPERVSDVQYAKEAFSAGDEEEQEVDDQDECQLHERLCSQVCINTPQSYQCSCFPGYTLQPDHYTCTKDYEDLNNKVDIMPLPSLSPTETAELDLCRDNGPCMQLCTQIEKTLFCSCLNGYTLMQDGISCEDIDECLTGVHSCANGTRCENTRGSFLCVYVGGECLEGFLLDTNRRCVDINECLTDSHTCHSRERCINTVGSFRCEGVLICPPGYQNKDDICEDINECELETHNCKADLQCQNTAGSFYCSPKQSCLTGFTRDQHGNCIDIDECSNVLKPCSSGFNCINTVGSYTCQRKVIMCSQGYHASSDGTRCVDVDECQAGVHQCGEGQVCHNLPGTYRCDCKSGYQYDMFSKTCLDINECWRYPGRLCAQTCENTQGSYHCSCTTGFTLAYDGKNCEDVNECTNNPCSQECANIYGSYQCYCRQGFYLKEDGHTCEDIDECSQSIANFCTFKCVNVPGSYQCTCPETGYTMSHNGRTCRDIDECAAGTHNCSTDEMCYNLQGGFRCLSFSCPQNYRKVSDMRCERLSCLNYLDCQSSPLRITYYQLSFQTNIMVPAQIFRIGPSPAYAGDNIMISITGGNAEGYFSTRKLNSYTGAVFLQRQVLQPQDFLIDVEMKLWRQGTLTTFLARLYVFITAHTL